MAQKAAAKKAEQIEQSFEGLGAIVHEREPLS